MPKQETDNREYRRLAIAAARMCSEGLTQKETATRMGRSQPEISRLLDFAEKRHYLAAAPPVLRHNIDDQDWEAADRTYFTSEEMGKLVRRLAPPKIHCDVRVFPEGESEFARAAAGRVVELACRSRRIGLLWGRTLLKLIDAIAAKGPLPDLDKRPDIDCIPLCGDPVFLINQRMFDYSSSHLASELGRAFGNSRRTPLPCLSGVPAYLSRKVFTPKDGSGLNWEDFLQAIPGYHTIFGGRKSEAPGLVDGVDAIITGAGIVVMGEEAVGNETGDFIKERMAQEQISKETLRRLIYGDIGGLLLERQNLRPKDQRLVDELKRGWTGLKDHHLQQVARGARANGSPGVIVVAGGANKAEMVREVVRRGYANELLLDSALAKALHEL